MNDDARDWCDLREACLADAPELARLISQLEHPTTSADVVAQWAAFQEAGNAALVVARTDGTLAGVAVLHRTLTLHRRAPVGRITLLVVDAPERGRGVGKMLVAAAEERLRLAGCELLEITSHVSLVSAHGFYEHMGYGRTSHRYAKSL
ncbi:MAG TPA: GNAT family N-acetyltransferase [Burkholderiaceae bacterium]|jgi:GNAT superfamily N-acetyltransferase|nr:GNAT family N-acetyltransferase [Burkholderiaceae bacterium]